jgi:hypothetical protein
MYFGRRFGLILILIVLGIALIYNCAQGLRSREGMYDGESTNIMFWAQLLGILAGIAMIAWGLNMARLVYGF